MEGAERCKKVFRQTRVNRFALKRFILFASKPESPDYIIWENLGIPWSTRLLSGSAMVLLMLFMELVTIFFMEEIQRVASVHHRAVQSDFCPLSAEPLAANIELYTHQMTRPAFVCFCR